MKLIQNRIVSLAEFETPKYQGTLFFDDYWSGYTAFMHFENCYGKINVKYFLQYNHKTLTRLSIEKSVNVSFEQFDSE